MNKETALMILQKTVIANWNKCQIKNLTPEQFQKIAQNAMVQKLTKEMGETLDAESQDIDNLVKEWLNRYKSQYTRSSLGRNIKKWLEWCRQEKIHPLLAKVRDADLFAANLPGPPAAVNSAIDAASSWYRTLLRWEKIQRTPFVDVKRRVYARKPIYIPTTEELEAILRFIKEYKRGSQNGHPGISNRKLHGAIAAMAYRGFRVGALPSLIFLPDGRFTTLSKAKNWTGTLDGAAKLLRPLGKQPFRKLTEKKIESLLRVRERMMVRKGLLTRVYSVHKFRHYFASIEYAKDKDILRISKLLNHADIGVTSRYLHSVGVLEKPVNPEENG